MGNAYLVSLDFHGKVSTVAVGGQHGILQRVLPEPVIHLFGSAPFGYPRQSKFRILQYPGPVEYAVDIEAGLICACHRALDQLGSATSAYCVRLVAGVFDKIAYRAFAYICAHHIMQKAFDAVVGHAHDDIEIDHECPYFRGKIHRVLSPCILHAIAASAGTGLVEKAEPFYDRRNPDTDTFFTIFLHTINIRQLTTALPAIIGLHVLGLIRLRRYHAGVAFMSRLPTGFLPAFHTQ